MDKIAELSDSENAIHSILVELLGKLGAKRGAGSSLNTIYSNIPQERPSKVYQVLRKAHSSSGSPIKSGGPHRGYYLDDEILSENSVGRPEETLDVPVRDGTNIILRESDLYPIVAGWLKLNKQYKQVSSQHANARSGGIWQNPDIVAINSVDHVGLIDVEIATCEVKLTHLQWRQYIFEAVSHRMRADRSYFVFRVNDDSFQIEPEMYRYAEKFKVGIVIIYLKDDEIAKVKRFTDLSEQDKISLIENVEEIVPAPRESIEIPIKIEMLRRLSIESTGHLYNFGNI